MTDIEHYLAEMAACLHVGRRHRRRILAEVADHLDDATDERLRAGEPARVAVAHAIDAFGPPVAMANSFNAEAGTRAMRRAPVVSCAAGVAVFAGLVIAGKSQPHPVVPMRAILATQVSFFVAVLAFQIAIVAGVCAASRALALGRTRSVRGDDRQFVRRAALISTGAVGVAAGGWTVALGISLQRLHNPDMPTALIGATIMVVAALAAFATIVTTCRLRVDRPDDTEAPEIANGLLGLGERTMDIIRRHPAVSCATVAAFSAWSAMAHAETTFSGALPWGVMQAATVVIAFIVLGPTLELRRPRAT